MLSDTIAAKTISTLACAALWVVLTFQQPTQQPRVHLVQPNPSTNQAPDSSTVNQPISGEIPAGMLDEINAIRIQLGGGVAKHLEGILPDRAPSLLDDSLWNDNSGTPSIPSHSTSWSRDETRSLLQKDFDRHLQVLAAGASSRTLPVDETKHFRTAARHLDLAAAELEDASQYEIADALRMQAQQLRKKARFPVAH